MTYLCKLAITHCVVAKSRSHLSAGEIGFLFGERGTLTFWITSAYSGCGIWSHSEDYREDNRPHDDLHDIDVEIDAEPNATLHGTLHRTMFLFRAESQTESGLGGSGHWASGKAAPIVSQTWP
jgi:hypothetical protein